MARMRSVGGKGQAMTFEIVNIISERRLNGKRMIESIAQDESRTIVNITLQETELLSFTDKSVGILLNKKYHEIMEEKRFKPSLKIGQIVGGE